MFVNIIPCQTAAVVPNPVYKWTTCTLNPDLSRVGILRRFFGFTQNLTEAYFVLLILSFITAMIVLHFIAGGKKE
jgi:hypothetical protein